MRRREFAALVWPSLLVMFGLLMVPLYRTAEWSFKDVDYGESGTFVGLDNYQQALTDERFGRAVLFTVGLTVAVTAVLLVAGYLLAVMVNRLAKTRPLVLGILLVSYVVPQVVGASMFSWLFDDNFGGMVNYLINSLTGLEIHWFTDPWPNRVMVGLNVVWHMLPFAMLVILAGLQGVPEEIIEAAKIDGASPLMRHVHVIIPSIRGVLGFVAVIGVMDVLRVFDQLIPLSPQAEQIGNESIMLYIFNTAFRDGGQQLGVGSAINILMIVIILLMLSPFIRDMAKEARKS